MACQFLTLGNGETVILCGVRRRKCKIPGCGRLEAVLCDWPLIGKAKGKTCSASLCSRCAKRVGELDYCPHHFARLVAAGVCAFVAWAVES